MTIRQHSNVLDKNMIPQEGKVPDIAYHKNCKNLFTMKNDLQSLSKWPAELVRESPSKFRVYEAICMFYQRKIKFKKKLCQIKH